MEREVYDKRSAWVWLLLTANHKDGEVVLEGNTFIVKRGSLMTSIRKLSEQWKWSKTKVQKFLNECFSHDEIMVETHKRMTMIHILNYEKHQGNSVEIEFKKRTTLGTTLGTTKKDDLNPVNTGDSDESKDDLKGQLEGRKKSTNKKDIKELKDILSVFEQIIGYLNELAGTRYSAKSAVTQRHINARLKEGFTFEDFQSVIRCKVSEWKDDPRMSAYIRPETLFGTKFESYLNQSVKQKPRKEGGAIPLFVPSQEDVEHYERIRKGIKGT